MKPRDSQCCDQQLLAILSDELEQETSESIFQHVSSCKHCQNRLEELAASKEVWNAMREAINSSVEYSDTAWTPGKNHHDLHLDISAVKQMLEKPSHPEMLGRLDRYEIERMIGVGGMGVVLKGYDSELSRHVAIKVLSPYLQHSGLARQRFAREARAAAAVVHQHVVPIYNVETAGPFPFLVMHYVAGESLQSRIERLGALEPKEVLRIGFQIADGLAAAHEQGLVHRDIKPSNILLESSNTDRALITDFGLARAADDVQMTRTGTFVGTPQYMSPEQASGRPLDQLSDLFSFGSVLFTMCTGQPPFSAETPFSVMKQVIEDRPPSVQSLNPDVPPFLIVIIERLHCKRPEDRFESAAQVRDLIKSFLSHLQQPGRFPLPAQLTTSTRGERTLNTGSWWYNKRLVVAVLFVTTTLFIAIIQRGLSGSVSKYEENKSRPNAEANNVGTVADGIERLGFNFSRAGNKILFGGVPVDEANRQYDVLLNDFGKEKYNVPESLANHIDAMTFRALSEIYAKDKNSVYYRKEFHDKFLLFRLTEADVDSFEIVSRNLAKDKNSAWFHGTANPNIDSDSLVVVREDRVWKDKDNVWYTRNKIEGAEPKSFEYVADEYYRDRNQAYWANSPLDGADVVTFRVPQANLPYARDRDTVWHQNKKMVNVDAASFEAIHNGVCKDKQGVYVESQLLPDVDAATFQKLSDLSEVNALFSDGKRHFVYLPYMTIFEMIEMDGGDRYMIEHDLFDRSQSPPKFIGVSTAVVTKSGIENFTGPAQTESSEQQNFLLFEHDFITALKILSGAK
ncbi:MAG: protein kinase [Pirellulaceae bacterium]